MQFEAGQRDWIEAREVSRERQGTGAWEGSRQARRQGRRPGPMLLEQRHLHHRKGPSRRIIVLKSSKVDNKE